MVDEIRNILKDSGNRYIDMADRIYTLPTVLSRFDGIGELTPPSKPYLLEQWAWQHVQHRWVGTSEIASIPIF